MPVRKWIGEHIAWPSGFQWNGRPWSNEHGTELSDLSLWTGLEAFCVAAPSCRGWTSASASDVGISVPVLPAQTLLGLPIAWPDAGTASCDTRRSVLCVNFTGLTIQPPLPAPGRRLFVTRATFPGAMGGVPQADRRCLDTARDGGLGGGWRAFLSATGAPFSIVPDGGGWSYRLDDDAGAVFQTAANLGTTPRHRFSFDEHGAPLDGGLLWTGTGLWRTPTSNDCAGWTSTDGGGTTGTLDRLDETWSNDGVTSCSANAHLLCLEE